jgi:DNA repair photolyase
MEINLGKRNPDVEYVRYETSSAFRRAGAFLPREILDMELYEYRLSPYMGCPKRCQYCFELHNEFIERDQVKIKTNTVETVRKTLAKLEGRKAVLLDGYDCEVAETKERLIRGSLEVILEYRMPLFIQTKSDLVLRDLDLLEELNDSTGFVNVSFSITDLNEKHNRIFEPYTCSPLNRMRAMKKISDAGILSGILSMPVLPFISDTEAELEMLFSGAVENGCRYIVYEPLKITNSGPQRVMCFNVLEEHFPQLMEKYERLYPYGTYGPKFGSGPTDPGYLRMLHDRIERLAAEYDVSTSFPNPEFGSRQTISRYQNTLDGFL